MALFAHWSSSSLLASRLRRSATWAGALPSLAVRLRREARRQFPLSKDGLDKCANAPRSLARGYRRVEGRRLYLSSRGAGRLGSFNLQPARCVDKPGSGYSAIEGENVT